MNRRSFLKALGLGSASVALSSMLDLAPIEPARSLFSCVDANVLLKDLWLPSLSAGINDMSPLRKFFIQEAQ